MNTSESAEGPAPDPGTDPSDVEYDRTDRSVLVVGAGAAGARAAIALVEGGLDPEDVLVLGKRDHGDAHTTWARGGINGALGTHDPEDGPAIHAADTLREGGFLNDPALVERVTESMPDRLRELDRWGMAFSRTDDGRIDQRYFGAQSFRRTAFAGDHTGESLMETLVARARELSIPYRENVMITRLLRDGDDDADRVHGAVGYDMDTGRFELFVADAVVLAAGGYSALYDRHTSRDDENTGDGPALALEAGADLMDVEFVQFHPTGMAVDESDPEWAPWAGRLVTEAVRAEGGRLYNTEGERFMERYSPDQMELDARDVVARAIAREVAEGRGTGNGGVYLDVSHRPREFIEERLPRMYERFDSLGVDMAEEPVEVAPTAHYGMGGVAVDEVGHTGVEGLYAVGETMAGVHGANRLGGNSLAETLAYGKITGDHLAATLADRDGDRDGDTGTAVDGDTDDDVDAGPGADATDAGTGADPDGGVDVGTGGDGDADARNALPGSVERSAREHFAGLADLANRDGTHDPGELLAELRSVLGESAGILRDDAGIVRGLSELDDIEARAADLSVGDRTDRSFEFAVDLGFALTVARVLLRGARERTESRGAHYRTDYPETDPEWRRNLHYARDDLGAVAVHTEPVGEPSPAVQAALDAGHELDYSLLE